MHSFQSFSSGDYFFAFARDRFRALLFRSFLSRLITSVFGTDIAERNTTSKLLNWFSGHCTNHIVAAVELR